MFQIMENPITKTLASYPAAEVADALMFVYSRLTNYIMADVENGTFEMEDDYANSMRILGDLAEAAGKAAREPKKTSTTDNG